MADTAMTTIEGINLEVAPETVILALPQAALVQAFLHYRTEFASLQSQYVQLATEYQEFKAQFAILQSELSLLRSTQLVSPVESDSCKTSLPKTTKSNNEKDQGLPLAGNSSPSSSKKTQLGRSKRQRKQQSPSPSRFSDTSSVNEVIEMEDIVHSSIATSNSFAVLTDNPVIEALPSLSVRKTPDLAPSGPSGSNSSLSSTPHMTSNMGNVGNQSNMGFKLVQRPTSSIPPIILLDTINWPSLHAEIKQITANAFTAKSFGNEIKLNFSTSDDYRTVTKFLEKSPIKHIAVQIEAKMGLRARADRRRARRLWGALGYIRSPPFSDTAIFEPRLLECLMYGIYVTFTLWRVRVLNAC